MTRDPLLTSFGEREQRREVHGVRILLQLAVLLKSEEANQISIDRVTWRQTNFLGFLQRTEHRSKRPTSFSPSH